MFGAYPLQCSRADISRAPSRQGCRELGDLFAVLRDEHLVARLQKLIQPRPSIGNQTSAGACSFEHPSWRREPSAGHALAIDVDHRARRAIEPIVVIASDVPYILYIGRSNNVRLP